MHNSHVFVISSKDALYELVSSKRFMLYGAGKVARELLKMLPANGHYVIERIIVSQLENDERYLGGIEISELDKSEIDNRLLTIIAVGQAYRDEILENLKNHKFKEIAIITENFENYLLSQNKGGIYSLIAQKDNEFNVLISKIVPRTKIKTLVVNICDHCNLNCQNCDHFSPIAEKRFISKEIVLNDLYRINQLVGERIDQIAIMGGEPLLHDDIEDIAVGARKIFPSVPIWISTNGILLDKREESFWITCQKNNITIVITRYPISFDYKRVEHIAEKHRVSLSFANGEVTEKTSYHIPLDLSGTQDTTSNFIHCFHSNDKCNMLSEGKLWTCTVAPNMWIFAKHFKIDLPMTEDDGIDIYSIETGRELFERLARPMPACRYCNVSMRTFGHPWKVSERRIEEWTI